MGYIAHHAIVVTTHTTERTTKAHETATKIGLTVTPVIESPVNGYSSFMVVPDGSKEGWSPSHEGDSRRNEFKSWLNAQKYDDGSTSYHWAEVRYSSDDRAAHITFHAWDAPHDPPEEEYDRYIHL